MNPALGKAFFSMGKEDCFWSVWDPRKLLTQLPDDGSVNINICLWMGLLRLWPSSCELNENTTHPADSGDQEESISSSEPGYRHFLGTIRHRRASPSLSTQNYTERKTCPFYTLKNLFLRCGKETALSTKCFSCKCENLESIPRFPSRKSTQ